jgi:hypothetical protein
MIKARLTTKVDDQFVDQLFKRINELGGSIADCEWDFGSSIQTTTYAITLPQGRLTAKEDTEDNFFFEGDEKLIAFLISQLSSSPIFKSTAID